MQKSGTLYMSLASSGTTLKEDNKQGFMDLNKTLVSEIILLFALKTDYRKRTYI